MALPGVTSGVAADPDEVVIGPRRAVFLDRDGVINRAVVRDGRPYPPDTLRELEILPGVAQALLRLRGAGFLTVVVTNQPDVATGRQSRATVDSMHARLLQDLALDAIKVCFHADTDGCACRKPRPGMLLEAARELGISLPNSIMIGDRWRDIAAGQAAGCRCYFLDYGYAERRPELPYATVESLADSVDRILGATGGS
jgi:D-glycero-D-manno-heptose 1,7-bisphosphate phosphatase